MVDSEVKSFMDFMPHMEQYSVIHSQWEYTLELIICVIHPGIPLLLNYCFRIQDKFAFHCVRSDLCHQWIVKNSLPGISPDYLQRFVLNNRRAA